MEQLFSDEYFMKEALKEARKAFERDEVPVGAVIVHNNRILARAHNLTETLNDVTAHAEMQAFTSAASNIGGKYLEGCTLYVTVEPCVMCAGASYWTQISKIVYGASDPKRGYTLIKSNLLQWSRSQQGIIEYHPTDTDVMSILADELRMLYKQALPKNIRIEVELEGVKRNILADENMLSSVIRNLISNAIKYSFQDSKILVKVCYNCAEVVFSVKDFGMGMEDVVKNMLFNLHEHNSRKGTNGEKGTGLGLLICADFIGRHYGKIWAESELNNGSTFYFSIPCESVKYEVR